MVQVVFLFLLDCGNQGVRGAPYASRIGRVMLAQIDALSDGALNDRSRAHGHVLIMLYFHVAFPDIFLFIIEDGLQ